MSRVQIRLSSDINMRQYVIQRENIDSKVSIESIAKSHFSIGIGFDSRIRMDCIGLVIF